MQLVKLISNVVVAVVLAAAGTGGTQISTASPAPTPNHSNDDLRSEVVALNYIRIENESPPEIEVLATAYTISKRQTGNLKGITRTGTKVKKKHTIAVDPDIIPLGSKVYVECEEYPEVDGYYIAEDTGGKIKGNRIDIFMGWGEGTKDYSKAMDFGTRDVTLTVVERGDFDV
ncbi:Cell wall-binding protein YocH precursor [compost metagenome]